MFLSVLQVDFHDWCQGKLLKYRNRCEKKENGCLVWGGAKVGHCKTKYGQVSLAIPQLSFPSRKFYIHRLVLMLEEGYFELPQDSEVSHLCGESLCINVDHLCIESHQTNAERRGCVLQGYCTEYHQPSCSL